MRELALLVQQTVGFLITLCFFVRFLDLALSYYNANRLGWAIVYGVLTVLLLLSVLITAGFHV